MKYNYKAIRLAGLIFIFFFCLIFKNTLLAQNAVTPVKLIRTIVYYTFEGAKSLEEVDALRSEIVEHKGVKEIKTIFKTEKKLAQLIVVFEESIASAETESSKDGVDKTFIKDVLIKHNYNPTDLFFEDLPSQ
jgi:hypothetical protein